ncbi:MAG TPA: hypothetical protein VHM91_16820, partial [Verrucomicrobiales bacterium]|nr:hypothetical protein [Verrucomicrobiales bacterium]
QGRAGLRQAWVSGTLRWLQIYFVQEKMNKMTGFAFILLNNLYFLECNLSKGSPFPLHSRTGNLKTDTPVLPLFPAENHTFPSFITHFHSHE